ncbi:hypothetical protein DYU11_06085 [Fibrisoma montanum]|uniref:Thioredoxin domain-containing protein n=2 Tax=Fibrisoma montanum TaxID=2305895 RepID=A0A418MDN3_9BACT|nr:hypothetical protein DYU11_06085 [Fibrisoma montanum]
MLLIIVGNQHEFIFEKQNISMILDKYKLVLSIVLTALFLSVSDTSAQITVRNQISENTPIVDKVTGRRISFQEYQGLIKPDPYAYHLEPVYDEYGQASSYKLRRATSEEHDTHGFDYRDSTLQLKIGQEIPLFIMKGADGKTYRSTDLKGQPVVLSFWLSLNKPFWTKGRADAFGKAIAPYQVVSLGIINNSKQEVADHIKEETLPFVPIPDSYGFARKFQMFSSPAFIVIDKTGKVAALIEGTKDEQLKTILEEVTR